MPLVYVIEFGPTDSKIGVSDEPAGRLRSLRGLGAGRVARQWPRPADARQVEAQAHRLLREFRVVVSGQRERFHVSAAAAARAVELAIVLVEEAREEEARRAALRAAARSHYGEVPRLAALPGGAVHVGYVRAATAAEASVECDILAAAGVEVARVHVDIGRVGAGLRAARRALAEQPGALVVAAPGRLDDAALAALHGEGRQVMVLALQEPASPPAGE